MQSVRPFAHTSDGCRPSPTGKAYRYSSCCPAFNSEGCDNLHCWQCTGAGGLESWQGGDAQRERFGMEFFRKRSTRCLRRIQDHARFVVQRLKPLIDSTYRTEPGQEHTAVMGSSMGGTISFLFAWWYPDVFSQAGCISTAIAPIEDRRLLDEIREYGRAKKKIRLYLDVGEFEPGLIPGYEALVSVLQEKGYETGKDLEFVFDRGEAHNEHAWANRLWRPLTFMFGTR